MRQEQPVHHGSQERQNNSSGTRIDIRYFFMSDRMAAGEMVAPAH
jgi:hypothetical protein